MDHLQRVRDQRGMSPAFKERQKRAFSSASELHLRCAADVDDKDAPISYGPPGRKMLPVEPRQIIDCKICSDFSEIKACRPA